MFGDIGNVGHVSGWRRVSELSVGKDDQDGAVEGAFEVSAKSAVAYVPV